MLVPVRPGFIEYGREPKLQIVRTVHWRRLRLQCFGVEVKCDRHLVRAWVRRVSALWPSQLPLPMIRGYVGFVYLVVLYPTTESKVY